MQLKPTVIYIIHDEDEYQRNTINQLSLSLGYDAVVIQCVSQLFVSLADPNQAVDAIIFDIHDLYCMQKTSAFDILSTTATLISCKYDGYNCSRGAPLIAVAALDTTPPEIIRDAIDNDVRTVYPAGPSFSIEEKSTCIKSMLDRISHIPSRIQEIISQKKKRCSNPGTINLTARQLQVARLICDRGASNKVIAKTLKISESTVKLHVSAVLKKYGVRNRTQLALFAHEKVQPIPL